MARLRSATWPSHQRLEKQLDIKSRFSTLQGYQTHLAKMWGFCAGVERRASREVIGDALADYDARRKLPLLTRDLVALGEDGESLKRLASCETLPICADPASAFGCLYVLEGATLGGRTLLPWVRSRLGLDADRGAAYLSSYGENVSSMWQGFAAALECWCAAPERQSRAADAAVATFDALHAWLCERPA